MRTALRYLCFAILIGFIGVAFLAQAIQHGVPFLLTMVVLFSAIAGAAFL